MKKRWMVITLAAIGIVAAVGVTAVVVLRHGRTDRTAAASVRKTAYTCPMHPTYLSDKPGDCPICGMKLVQVRAGGEEHASRPDGAVRIDPAVEQNMGVTTETVRRRSLTREIHVSTVIEPNETAVTNVNTKVMGWVDRLYADFTGQQVERGRPLLTIYSPDLVSTQEEYLQALRYLNSIPADAIEARRGAMELVESGRRRLLNWDIPEAEISRIGSSGVPEKVLTVYSPVSGVVLDKAVLAGQNVQPGAPLYRIADLRIVWAVANVHQEDLPFVKIGERAAIELPSLPGKVFQGRVEFIAPVLDSVTKTAAVRITVRNTPDFALKPQMFVNVTIASTSAKEALAVSEQAVLHTGKRDVVIVSLGNGYFRPQEVTLGPSAGGYTQVLQGLEEGQTIVISSQFMIDAESNLRTAVGALIR